MAISQTDGGKRSTFLSEGRLAFAQLRDMLAAEDSSVVPKEDDHGRTVGPQRTESKFAPVGIGEHDLCQFAAERLLHGSSILRSVYSAVKPCTHPAEKSASTFHGQRIALLLIDLPAERA